MLKTLFDQEYYAKWYSQHINYPNIKEEHCLEVKGGGLCFPLGRGDPLLLIVKWIGFCTSYFWEMRQIEDENVCKSNSIRKEKPFKNNCVSLQHFPKSPHFHSDVQNCRHQFRDYFGIKQTSYAEKRFWSNNVWLNECFYRRSWPMQWWPCEGKVYVKLDNTYVLVIISFVFCSNIRCILDFKDIAVFC